MRPLCRVTACARLDASNLQAAECDIVSSSRECLTCRIGEVVAADPAPELRVPILVIALRPAYLLIVLSAVTLRLAAWNVSMARIAASRS